MIGACKLEVEEVEEVEEFLEIEMVEEVEEVEESEDVALDNIQKPETTSQKMNKNGGRFFSFLSRKRRSDRIGLV